MTDQSQAATLRAIGLMVIGMAFFAAADAAIKVATQTLSAGQIVLFMAVGDTAFFVVVCRMQRVAIWDRGFGHWAVLLRNSAEIVAAISIPVVLAIVALSTLSAVFQAVPLVTTIGAAVLLREQVGPWRWGAVCVGMIGVIVILRPGVSGFDSNAVWAFVPVMALAFRDLMTRRVPRHLSTLQLATWGFGVLVPVGIALTWVTGWQGWPTGEALAAMIVVTLCVAVGYVTVTTSLRVGDVAAVAPFRYTRLLFALLLAVFLLGERVDMWTLLGAGIVVSAGLVTLWRESRVR